MTARLFNVFIIIFIAATALGCKKELSDPHTIDPIYNDLSKEHSTMESKVKSEEKRLDAALAEFNKTEPRSLDRKIKAREVEKAKESLQKYRQLSEYYRIKAELRRAYGKKEYQIAFQKGEPWPRKEDIDAYFTAKDLREAPRKWSVRVPGSPNYDPERISKKKRDE